MQDLDNIEKEAEARKTSFVTCPVCWNEIKSLGYASHMSKHQREREKKMKERAPSLLIRKP